MSEDANPVDDCTIDAQWTSSNTRAVTAVDGLVRAVAAGRAGVTAEYRGEVSPGVLVKSGPGPGIPVLYLPSAGGPFRSRSSCGKHANRRLPRVARGYASAPPA